jgi:hypothetical protein
LLKPKVWAQKSRVGGSISRHTSWIEQWLFLCISAPVGVTMKKLMRCRDNRRAAAEEAVDELFAEAEQRLKRHKYLCGDSMTAADITFSSLAYPCAFPPEHAPVDIAGPGTGPDDIPEFTELRDRYAASPAVKHILHCYAHHRWPQSKYAGASAGASDGAAHAITPRAGGPRDRISWPCVVCVAALVVAVLYQGGGAYQ